MNIISVSGQNFLTLGEFDIRLKERGLVLIQGENGDDPSADSNGAGKSSLPDAISWALYGTTARGITGDAVVNRTRPKECIVTVVLEDDATMYYITRYRNPNGLKVQMSVKGAVTPGGGATDITKGTQAETQELINRIMGCGLEVFNAAVYAGQDAMPDLPGMTDKQLKLLIEEAAGVEVLADAYKIATDRALKVYKAINDLARLVDTNEAHAASLKANIKSYDEETDKFKAKIKTELTALGVEATALAPKLKAAVGDLHKCKIDHVATKSAIANFKSEAQKEKDRLEWDLRRTIEENSHRETSLRTLDADVEKAYKKWEAAKLELTGVKARVGTPCRECGKPIEAADLEKLTETLQKKVTEAQKTYDMVKKQDRGPMQRAAEMTALEVKRINGEIAKVGDVSAYAALVNDLREYESLVNAKDSLTTIAAKTTEKIRELRCAISPYAKLKVKAEAELDEVLEDIATHKMSLAATQEEHQMLTEAAKVFGQAGVRAHILDTVTPFLNAKTSEYLGVMTDGNIHAVWNTLQKTAKGELRERFNIEVTNDMGAESFAGLSGGEKRKVRLAATMALQDMVASRAEKPLNIFIADEIDNALDESGLERLMTVLETKARERGTVLIISHNSLSDWCDQVITVTKKAGISTINDES